MDDRTEQLIYQTIHELEKLIEYFEGKNDMETSFQKRMVIRRAKMLQAELKRYGEINS